MSIWENQVVALSGASLGIGRALALQLAGRGANLVLNARAESPLNGVAENCRAQGAANVAVVPGNIGDLAVAQAVAQAGQEFGGVTQVIHAAGVLAPGPTVAELPEADFRAVVDASLTGTYALWRACQPDLKKNSGGFVVFGSGAADIAQPGIGAYCAAKAAEEHLARQLAAEEPGVTTFVYRPGIVETRMQAQARESQGGAAEQVRAVFKPWREQGKLLTPEHSAAYVLRLLENSPRDVHGQTVRAQ